MSKMRTPTGEFCLCRAPFSQSDVARSPYTTVPYLEKVISALQVTICAEI